MLGERDRSYGFAKRPSLADVAAATWARLGLFADPQRSPRGNQGRHPRIRGESGTPPYFKKRK
jgi:hypothetical protein